jgi:hypothetical protein
MARADKPSKAAFKTQVARERAASGPSLGTLPAAETDHARGVQAEDNYFRTLVVVTTARAKLGLEPRAALAALYGNGR